MESRAWVVVANTAKARIFLPKDLNNLEEVEVLLHPEAKQKNQDLVSDRPGRSFDSKGTGRHGMEPKTTAKEAEANHFAKYLAEHLDKGRTQNMYRKLYLIASPAFLGLLRESLTNATLKTVAFESPKDFTEKEAKEIRAHLPPII